MIPLSQGVGRRPETNWTLPIGGGAGWVFKVGKLPINLSFSAYYNIAKPTYGGDWQLRTRVTVIFQAFLRRRR
jgi:hypothetical protein